MRSSAAGGTISRPDAHDRIITVAPAPRGPEGTGTGPAQRVADSSAASSDSGRKLSTSRALEKVTVPRASITKTRLGNAENAASALPSRPSRAAS